MPGIELLTMRRYYESGLTRPYSFRRRQLQLLRQTVLKREKEINAVLYSDLRKSPEEVYATETGLLLAEISSYGRIINTSRFDKLAGYLALGKMVIGGETDREDLFIAPTVMEDVPPDSPLMHEEIFGPILPVYPYKNREEALALIKRNENPLAFYVFTADSTKEKAWIEGLAFGGGCVNNTAWHFANRHFPFGGIGNSGMGAYHGRRSFDTFSHAKPVLKTPTWFDPDLRYPPFAGKLKWFKLFTK